MRKLLIAAFTICILALSGTVHAATWFTNDGSNKGAGTWEIQYHGVVEYGVSESDSATGKPSNGKVWRWTFPPFTPQSEWDLSDSIATVWPGSAPPSGQNEFWIQYWWKYSPGFDWHPVANKQFYFNPSNVIGAILRSGDPPTLMAMGPQGPNGQSYYPNVNTDNWYGNTGQWHKYTGHYKMNTSSSWNGIYEAWVDDIKISDYDYVYYADGTQNLTPGGISFAVIWGGVVQWLPRVGTGYLYIDDIYIGNTAPGGGGVDGSPPYVYDFSPSQGESGVPISNRIITWKYGDATGIDQSTISFKIEGVSKTCSSGDVVCSGTNPVTVTYTNAADWSNSQTVDITEVTAEDTASPANAMPFTQWSFVTAPSGGGEGWSLVFSDEFNDGGCTAVAPCHVDSDDWHFVTGTRDYEGPNDAYYMDDDLDNASVQDGDLVLTARYESYGGKSLTTAMVETDDAWTFGKIEVRAKTPDTYNSINCAAWSVGTIGGSWPEYGEMDFFEYVPGSGWGPNMVSQNVHSPDHQREGSYGGYVDTTTLPSLYSAPDADYHVYTAYWYSDHIDMYIDGNFHFTRPYTSDYSPALTNPHQMRLYLSTGDIWGAGGIGSVDAPGDFPISCRFDYIRVYQAQVGVDITTTSLPDGTEGQPYNADLSAIGGNSPYTWSITAGSLPDGSVLSSGGNISAAALTVPGDFNFTVKAADTAEYLSDDFNRSNEAPISGSNWFTWDYGDCQLNLESNAIEASACFDEWTVAAMRTDGTFGADQWSQATIKSASITGDIGGPGVRMTDCGDGEWNGYFTHIENSAVTRIYAIDDCSTYTWDQIGADITGLSLATDDDIKLEVIGDTLYFYINDSLEATRQDTGDLIPSGGAPGVTADYGSLGIWDDWIGGNVGDSDTQALSIHVNAATPGGQGQTVLNTSTGWDDTFINSGAATTNYSTSTVVRLYQWPAYTAANVTLGRANISTIPANVTIIDATLYYYMTGYESPGGSNPMWSYVRRVTGSVPDISTVTWSSFAGTYGSAEDSATISLLPGWVGWNITDMLTVAYEAVDTYLYFALTGGSDGIQDTNRIFASEEYTVDTGLRPYIVVNYYEGGIPPISAPGRMIIQGGIFK
jgi:hypothetical protein